VLLLLKKDGGNFHHPPLETHLSKHGITEATSDNKLREKGIIPNAVPQEQRSEKAATRAALLWQSHSGIPDSTFSNDFFQQMVTACVANKGLPKLKNSRSGL
jgi:hypothetical protein